MAARMVSGVRRSEHITSVLEDLHWLPVSQRVVFKTALMVWKCVHGVAPAYLSDLCSIPATVISGRQHLRSAATGTLLLTRARSFAVNGPATWSAIVAREPNTHTTPQPTGRRTTVEPHIRQLSWTIT